MQLINTVWILLAFCLAGNSTHAGPDHHDHHKDEHVASQHHMPQSRGPHGGLLLQEDDTSVELQIFEKGVPPEYRAWVTKAGKPVTQGADLSVQLTRLEGRVDDFDFAFRGDYWLGSGVVTEPHSFDVEVTLVLNGKQYQWQWDTHEGRTRIAPDMARKAGITTAQAGPGAIERTLTTYGRLTTAPEKIAQVQARFPGIVTSVNAKLGDRVDQGELLAQVESNESLNVYDVRAPINGTVIERLVNVGEMGGEQALFTIADLTTLWAELQVFPGQRKEVAVDQKVNLSADGVDQETTIKHLLPSWNNVPYTVARVELDNAESFLSPGLLVEGDIVVESLSVQLAVDNRALQPFRDWTVVFIQVDDTYEIRPLELGRTDGTLTEVLGGLQAGDHYVVENSYLIKADIEKSGATHDH